MNAIRLEPEISLSHRAVGINPKESPSLAGLKNHVSCRPSSVPLSFHCLGGNWEGHIHLLKTGIFQLRIQGLPPVQVGQELQFQGFGHLQASFSQLSHGVIQKVFCQAGFPVKERTTDIFMKPSISQGNVQCSFISQQGSFHKEQESFIFGQVTDGEVVESCETEQLAPGLSPFQSSRASNARGLNAALASESRNIKSTQLSLPNTHGQAIKAYHDFPIGNDLSTLAIVVIAPGYGETKRDYLTLAYYFASNGFHVIRYDHTNHVGESDGDHHDISLTSMKEDFQAVTHYVGTQWPTKPIVGVAASLASRIVIKAEADCSSVSLFISLMGIVDVQESLAMVHQEDLFAGYLEGHFPESANILGFNVGNAFLQDALENDFSTLESTLRDIASLSTQVLLVSAGKDAWVDQQAVQTVSRALGSSLVHNLIVPESLHRLQENPKTAQATYRHVIQQCHHHLDIVAADGVVQDPNRLILGRQKRKEKINQQQSFVTEMGVSFWEDYLGHFRWIGKCPDYVKLLDHAFHALGPMTPGQYILDAGCGNGNAGLFLLHELEAVKNGQQPSGGRPLQYIGVDLVPEALEKAKTHMTHTLEQIERSHPTFSKSLQMSWAQVDLQHTLPFADNQFDKIVSNLVLGYVKNPQIALQELYRVLAPGGRMVLSNLKPNGDFSAIYQNLIESAGQPAQREEARRLLHNYGKIRQAEKEDQFRFFDKSEWHAILHAFGCLSAGVYPTFANQAYLVVLEKPAVLTSLFQEAGRKVLPVPLSIEVAA